MSSRSRTSLSRRKFLEDSMLAAAAAVAAGGVAHVHAEEAAPASKSPNEKLGVACVGVRGQGNSHLGAYSRRPDTEVLYVCDVDESVGQQRVKEVAARQGRAPKYVQDLRQMLEDKSVDIVTTATPNHWHALVAIWAIQNGKDVYVEKPVSHNVSEGRRIVDAARKYNRICQTGTQCRSMKGSIDAIKYVHEGKIGKLSIARGLCYKSRPSIGPKGDYPIPASVNYDLWSGPAPVKPLTREKLHYDWHWMWDYGNGDLGNQGIHQMDLARWGLGAKTLSTEVVSYGGRLGYEDAGETANTQTIIHDYGDQQLVFEVRGLPTEPLRGAKVGVIFEGADGFVVLTEYTAGAAFDLKGNKVAEFQGGGDHHGNFLKAVRSRNPADLNADILEGHLSSALCHMGNISYRLGTQEPLRQVEMRLAGNDDAIDTFERFSDHLKSNGVDIDKAQIGYGRELHFDIDDERFVNDSQADAMLTREYRAPFIVPPAGRV
ncbi:MAG TPA: Gfo/Idh/MocA family oxidoreductase [Pirellulales bacterium]|nr:Gfo/Idh/MocA family oxidoreductase [Pirellulales bacterium]